MGCSVLGCNVLGSVGGIAAEKTIGGLKVFDNLLVNILSGSSGELSFGG